MFLIKDRVANKCCFYRDYFGVGKKVHSRVKLARKQLHDNCSKYPCLSNSGADATSKGNTSTTEPTSNDGMLSPLPWCVDIVGAITANDNNSGKPWPISVIAKTNVNRNSSHYLWSTNHHENVSVHESVDSSVANPTLQFSDKMSISHALAKPPSISTRRDTANDLGSMCLCLCNF